MSFAVRRPAAGQPWRPVLFDMDGTLIDSAPAIINRLRETLEHFGVSVPPDSELRHYIGPPTLHTLTEFLPADHVIEAAKFYRTLGDRDGLANQALFTGAPSALETLAGRGVPLAVASSKPQHEVEHIAQAFGIASFFAAVVGSSEDRQSKADVVETALLELNQVGDSRSEPALMVGDRIWDIAGAAEKKVPSVLVSWGYARAGEEKDALALIRSFDDLVRFVENQDHA